MSTKHDSETDDGRKPIALKPVALDGGYGWLVVLGSFFIHVFADGFVYSFGVIAASLLGQLDTTSSEVGVVLALLVGFTMTAGPLASAICNRFGCRITTIIGAVIASVACLASSFATSIWHLIITTGVFMGIGFGLMYCPAIIIVTMYFEKRRSLATSISVCGAGVGTLVFPKIFELLLEYYGPLKGWRRVFQIYSGVVLLCVPCAALFRPVHFEPIYADEDEDEEMDEQHDAIFVDEELLEEGKNKKAVHHRSFSEEGCVSAIGQEKKGRLRKSSSGLTECGIGGKRESKVRVKSGYLNVSDCFYPRSITGFPEYKNDPEKFRSISLSVSKRTLSNEDVDNKKSKMSQSREMTNATNIAEEDDNVTKNETDSKSTSTGIWQSIKKMMDLALLAEPVYMLFAIANFFISVGFDPPPIFMPMYAGHMGWSKSDASMTVSVYGISSIIGRITFGLICDFKLPFACGKDKPRNRLWIFSISMILCGLSCCFTYWMSSFWSFIIFCFFFGFSISACVCLFSVVLVDLVGVNRLTNALGLLLLIQGIATFIGPPIAGVLRDVTHDYYWTFSFCGICILLGGILLAKILLVYRLFPETKYRPAKALSGIRENDEPTPTVPRAIYYDAKGFSSNDLALLNRKNVAGGCALDSVRVDVKESIVLVAPNNLLLPLVDRAAKDEQCPLLEPEPEAKQVLGNTPLRIVEIQEYLDRTNA